ncbi:hypothetical protein F0562_033774 [Nyssa sinensis]|uniref:Ribosomal protein L34Ae n=1 Tax=Nyssa sinensis TaxID=561372 RepID=A0A5J5AIW5_9ASTE|nr:hypothetical protein F0562_033774 [Nyssa sinensis]
MEEPETMSFTVQELFVGSNDASIVNNRNQDTVEKNFQQLQVGSNNAPIVNNGSISTGFSDEQDFQELNLMAETVDEEKAEDSVERNQFLAFDSKPEPDSSSDGFSIENNKIDSISNEFFTVQDVDEELESEIPVPTAEEKLEVIEKNLSLEEISEAVVSRDEAEDTDDEYIELKPNLHYSDDFYKERLSGKDLGKFDNKQEVENADSEDMELIDDAEKSEEPSSGRKLWDSDSDDEDEDGLEILWEQRDLIEQMKMELKNARTGGLPTILEESESSKMTEDLKPLKIDEKFEHKDRVEEIRKVYKSYAERMRKLDIMNYQTMHAISFIQLKDPVQLTAGQRPVSAIKSLLFPNFWPCKLRRIYADPTLKSINELHRDLELVYVGQVCLSWEILHWQYGKAKELLELDSQGYRPYNQVAGEFQQLQVLLQRFVENEQFQGPRVQDYVKNRCTLRAFLQVPAIKDDCLKDKESRVEEKDVIPIAMLTEIIEESMRTFWEFLRADKDEANVILKGFQGTHVDLQAPSDSELLMDIKSSLQKKEKRLKDILRSGNCIVKKFQKHQEDRLDQATLFARVELRLVSRVLNMSRLTTDQLVWCQMKLNKINIVSRKIHVEPSFLLFPF